MLELQFRKASVQWTHFFQQGLGFGFGGLCVLIRFMMGVGAILAVACAMH